MANLVAKEIAGLLKTWWSCSKAVRVCEALFLSSGSILLSGETMAPVAGRAAVLASRTKGVASP